MNRFQDFELVLRVVGEQLHVALRGSAAGGAARPCPSRLPPAAEIEALAAAFEGLRGSRDYELFRQTTKGLGIRLAEIGERLFAALMVDEVREQWARCGGGDPGSARRLRLRLEIPIGDAEGSSLHSIPWECLRLPGFGFAAVDEALSVVRYVPGTGRDVAPPHPGRMVVLVVASQAPGLPPLDLESELDELFDTGNSRLRFELFHSSSLDRLHERLAGDPVHAIHFMGHGGVDGEGRRGLLLLDRGNGEVDAVSGQRLATALRPARSLRLAFFNACHTAAEVAGAPFRGVATAAIRRAGVPAVIAMQYPIPDRDATSFAGRVYRRLAEGRSLDEAVTDARLLLYHQAKPSWVVPVLFSRLEGGELFAAAERSGGRLRRWVAAVAAVAAILLAILASCQILHWHDEPVPIAATVSTTDVVGSFHLTLEECRFVGRGEAAQLHCLVTIRNDGTTPQPLAVTDGCTLIDNQGDPYSPTYLRLGGRLVDSTAAAPTYRQMLAPDERSELEIVFDTISRQERKAEVLRVPLGDLGTAEFEAFFFARDRTSSIP